MEPSSDASSSVDSERTQDILKRELPNTLPNLLESLGIKFENLRALTDGASHFVYAFTDQVRSTSHVIRVSIDKALDEDSPFQGPKLDDQVAILQCLEPYEERFKAIPKVSNFDATSNNPIDRPYMIESFIPGDRLDELWDDLSLEDKLGVVEEIVKIELGKESVAFGASGTLESGSGAGKTQVGPFKQVYRKLEAQWDHDLSIRDWLLHLVDFQVSEWKRKETRPGGRKWEIEQISKVGDIVRDMDEIKFFDDPRHTMSKAVLYHPDLHHGNFFLTRDGETNRLKLAGVIDWDNAQARPLALAREAPQWLWEPEELDEDEELLNKWDRDLNHLPKRYWSLMSEEDKALKAKFDDCMRSQAPSNYFEDAYGPGLWMRRAAKFAMWGLSSNWEMAMLTCLFEEWTEYMSAEHGKRSRLEAAHGKDEVQKSGINAQANQRQVLVQHDEPIEDAKGQTALVLSPRWLSAFPGRCWGFVRNQFQKVKRARPDSKG